LVRCRSFKLRHGLKRRHAKPVQNISSADQKQHLVSVRQVVQQTRKGAKLPRKGPILVTNREINNGHAWCCWGAPCLAFFHTANRLMYHVDKKPIVRGALAILRRSQNRPYI